MDYGLETIKRHTRAAHNCLAAGKSPWERAWTAAYKLYSCSVCDVLRHCSSSCGVI